MTAKPLIEIQYLPPLPYMALFAQYEQVYLDIQENYQKQSYRNRTYIQVANKILPLSVHVHKTQKNEPIQQITIDYQQDWLRQHWRSLESAYGKAPFFEHYIDFFREIYFEKPKFLVDLNTKILTTCLHLLNIPVNFVFFKENLHIGKKNDYIDLRGQIHPKKGYAPIRQNDTKTYWQVFGKGFVKNLSIVDVLFCEGPQAATILRNWQICPDDNNSLHTNVNNNH